MLPDAHQLQQIWYGGAEPPLSLRALAGVYGMASSVRRNLYRSGLLKTEHLPVPVIVVGNINIGGTGKTPLVIALVEALRTRGWNPGVISRGYAGTARVPMQVTIQASPLVVGDEASLIHRVTSAPVAVGRNRIAAAHLLLTNAKPDVLIADDGLQHYVLYSNVDICVIDGIRRFGNGRLLPAGPLREPLTRLETVQFRVCNGGAPATSEIAMSLSGDSATSLTDPQQCKSLREFTGQRVHAIAGIGNPARFFSQLRAAGLDLIEHPFPDHHAFEPADLDFGDVLPVLMTEKDAVKCTTFAHAAHWHVPIRAELPETFFDAIANRLKSL